MAVIFSTGVVGADFLLTRYLYETRQEKEIRAAEATLQHKAESLRERFIQEMNRVRGIPAMIGDEQRVIDALVDASDETPAPPKKIAAAQQGALLKTLDRHLQIVATELGYDAVWVIDRKGAVLASNHTEQGETGFADAAFFRDALAGGRGFQYAVGQQPDKPDLYFSAPVRSDAGIIGVVAIKLPASRLQRFVENDEVFITEENGIIIAAHDPKMIMRSTEPRRLEAFSKDTLLSLYKKADFMPLNSRPAGIQKYPKLMKVADWPGYYLFSKCTYCDCGLSLQVYTRISRLDEIESESFLVSLVAILGGAAVFLLIMGIVAHMHRIRRDNKQLQATEIKLLALNHELEAHRQTAEEANRAKSEFLANMSHEIRTPLNGVLATAELLAKMNLDEKQKKHLDIIRSSGELLLVIINDILDLSKIEAGKIDFQPACIDLRHEAEITASLFVAQAKAKDLRFEMKVGDELPQFIVADPYRMRQVVANLISNAIKYTDRGSVEARFGMAGDSGNPRLRFEVADTGSGIPKEAQRLVFEKFTQMNRRAAINGTGLGLPICQALIEMMDGKIGVISDGVNGSTFWFEVPLIVSSAADTATGARTASANTAPAGRLGCHVLLVEDIEINRFVISEMLAGLNCTVETANNGQSALEMMARKTYDLVFMDCSMPVMNGFDATRERRNAGDATTPIIALTAHIFPEEIEKCLHSGMTDFISKPVKFESLQEVLDKWGTCVRQTIACREAILGTGEKTPDKGFDASILDEWFAVMPAKAETVVELTLKDGGRLYEEVVRALTSGDSAELAEGAHALKTVAKQVGGIGLADLCTALEALGKDGKAEEALARIGAFRKAYEDFRRNLLAIRTRNGRNSQSPA